MNMALTCESPIQSHTMGLRGSSKVPHGGGVLSPTPWDWDRGTTP
jgi:hypothetical protein